MSTMPSMDACLTPSPQQPSAPVPGSPTPRIAQAIVDQAIVWYVLLASGTDTAQDRHAFEQWRDADAEHARAWARLEDLGQQLRRNNTHVAPLLTHAALTRLEVLSSRRRMLKHLAWAGVAGSSLYLIQGQLPWRRELTIARSDFHTGTGEHRRVVLEDGTQLALNTATVVDRHFDAHRRHLILRSGEISIATAKDRARRPFVVTTHDGTLEPVGTRFVLRRHGNAEDGGFTQLTVTEGAVDVRVAHDATQGPVRIHAGQQVRFTRAAIDAPGPLNDEQLAWTEGMLTAESMRLDAFLTELGRYRAGWLRCTPDVASLRITGTWPIYGAGATDRILASLARRLPVQVTQLTRYWVTVVARSA